MLQANSRTVHLLGHDHFPPYPFQFINSSTFRCYITWDRLSYNNPLKMNSIRKGNKFVIACWKMFVHLSFKKKGYKSQKWPFSFLSGTLITNQKSSHAASFGKTAYRSQKWPFGFLLETLVTHHKSGLSTSTIFWKHWWYNIEVAFQLLSENTGNKSLQWPFTFLLETKWHNTTVAFLLSFGNTGDVTLKQLLSFLFKTWVINHESDLSALFCEQ
jgi:hypothetical protein